MIFQNPDVLMLLAIIPLFMIFFTWRTYARQQALLSIGDESLIQTLTSRISSTRRNIQTACWLMALGCLIVASARPVWGVYTETVSDSTSALMILFDVSLSMDAEDISPSRLERAKTDILSGLNELDNTAVGLVIFARNAHIYMPITGDLTSVAVYVRSLSTRSLTNQGTAIADAIQLALDNLSGIQTGSKAIMLLTDGENHQDNPLDKAERAFLEGVPIHTRGYGTEVGSVIPVKNDSGDTIDFKLDENGILVESRLNVELLQEIADMTGGVYQQVSNGSINTEIFDGIESLNQDVSTQNVRVVPHDRSSVFVFLALLFLLVERTLPVVRKPQ